MPTNKNGMSKNILSRGPKVHKGEIYHSDMAESIMAERSFLTLSDTKQVLCYDESTGIYRFDGEIIIQQLAQIWLGMAGLEAKATTHFMEQVIDFIRRETYIDREALNPNPGILVVKNGTLSLVAGTLVKHSKAFKATIAIPVTYDINAKCPVIDKFLSEIVAPGDLPLLCEIPAWCLTTRSGIQRLVLLLGEGRNGKTTYLEMLREFLGRGNCTAHTLQSLTTNRFAIAGLFGKLANIAPDLPSRALREAGPLKTLTGSDTVEAEKKFKDSFNFINSAKMIFATNTPPEITEDTYAVWRRIVMVDFPYKFEGKEEDKQLLSKITTERELSGFLNIVLKGLERINTNGDFTYSRSIEDTRSKYLLMSNPTQTFIEEYCVFDSWSNITKEELYQGFMKFCEENKLPGIAKKAFGHKVKQMYMLTEAHDKWQGIKIKWMGESGSYKVKG